MDGLQVRLCSACRPARCSLVLCSSAALLRLLSEQQAVASRLQGVEQNEDQAAANHLYAAANNGSSGVGVSVDSNSEVFVDLYGCKGSGSPRTFLQKWQLCHNGEFSPLRLLRRNGTRLELRDNRGRNESRFPLIAHASGFHDHLGLAYAATGTRTARWSELFAPSESMLAQPVLLVDSAHGGVCEVTSLGSVLRSSHVHDNAQSVPPSAPDRAWRRTPIPYRTRMPCAES